MKFHPRPVAMLIAVLLASSANAQLKLPRDARAPATSGPAAPAQPSQPAATASPAQPAKPAAASDSAEKEAAGKLAAAGWLVLLDRRDWGRAWETSSAVFRGAVPLANWMDGIPKVREPFGNFVERTPAESMYKTTLEGRPDGDYVSVIFATKFEKKEVQEIVTTVREADGKWRVTGYSTR
jgi:nucleoid-associated protein YgaU